MRNSESGNVLFYILIAVVLIAALSFAVSQSQRGSMTQVNDEKSKVIASELIEYASAVSTATAQLRLRGVAETDLCFDDAGWGNANYTHAACTIDENKIFHLKGGGVTWSRASAEAMNSAATPDYLWHIYGDNEIEEVGTTCGSEDCSELILVADELNEDVCIKINESLDVTDTGASPPTDTNMATTYFAGVFDYNETIGNEAGGQALTGRTAACFRNTTNGKYTFYKVLMAR